MDVLVTGSAGFIGSRVAFALLTEGHRVLGLDSLNAAYDPRVKNWRLEQLSKMPRFSFVAADVSDPMTLFGIVERWNARPAARLDAVINLAARAGVRDSLVDPWAYYQTNVVGTLNVLESCRRFGIGKMVLASTSSVYGNLARREAKDPQHEGRSQLSESMATDSPVSPYAASKKAAEVLCHSYHELYGLDTSILRFFTVYGPAGRPDMAVFRFVRWIVEGEPVAVYGDGSAERDFVYVDDVAAGVVLALKPLGLDVINLGGNSPICVRDVIALVERLTGKRATVTSLPAHPADVAATWADIRKARGLLGWQPQTSFEEGMRRTVDWYMENRWWAATVAV